MTPTSNEDVVRRIDELRADILNLGTRLEANYVRKDVQDAREMGTALQIQGLEEGIHNGGKRIDGTNTRIDKIEERLTAHFRLILGTLIYPLIVLVLGTLIYAVVHR